MRDPFKAVRRENKFPRTAVVAPDDSRVPLPRKFKVKRERVVDAIESRMEAPNQRGREPFETGPARP